jgi:outer membrane biosynthesis protein TonB
MRRIQLRYAALVIGATLLLSSCSYLEQFTGQADDQAITAEIQSKLFADSVLKMRDIQVNSQKGVVTLNGSVNTDVEKAAVERIASEAKGVKQVVNQLSVAPAATAPAVTPPETATATPPPEPAPVEQPKAKRRGEQAAPKETAPEPEPESQAAAAPAAAAPAPAPAPPEPVMVTIPAGTVITVRMIDGIDSSSNRPGEEFAASVDAPVVVGNHIVIRHGADARVRLVEVQSAGRMTGRSELAVELVGLAIGSNTYAVESGVFQKQGASRGKRTAATVGGGAALGGLIGAIAGKGKGAAIGAAVGAGAGTAVQASTHGQQVQIPPETKIDFTLKSPITLQM